MTLEERFKKVTDEIEVKIAKAESAAVGSLEAIIDIAKSAQTLMKQGRAERVYIDEYVAVYNRAITDLVGLRRQREVLTEIHERRGQ